MDTTISLNNVRIFREILFITIDFFSGNRIWEYNGILKAQCSKLEKDMQHLRLANADLEKTSIVK